MPAVLLRHGLRSALADFITEARETHSLTINDELNFTNDMLSQQASVHLYRIVQEIVLNTVKHAGASRIDIKISRNDDQLTLLAKDDGKGFDQTAISRKQTGVGLRSISNRVDVLQGEMFLESRRGTAYTIIVPCLPQGSSSSDTNP